VLGLKEGRLTVAVEDVLWQRNLQGLSGQILANLQDLVGPEAPGAIEFVVGAPRRPPQQERPAATAAADEADAIADPVLRQVYLNSRKRARA
jgi:hypothetical protein